MADDSQSTIRLLREKALQLVHRERDLLALRQRFSRTSAWLAAIQRLSQEVDPRAGVAAIPRKAAEAMIREVHFKAVVIFEVDFANGILLPRAALGTRFERDRLELTSSVSTLIESRPAGICNDGGVDTLRSFAELLGLDRFLWQRFEPEPGHSLLMGAGFDRQTAAFHNPFDEADASYFRMMAQHIEVLLRNVSLMEALEHERQGLRDLNHELEQRVEERTRELADTNAELAQSLLELKRNQARLIEAERKAAVARLERELAIATQIQTSILPRCVNIEGVEIAARMLTASEVGGDYYDVQPSGDGGCWFSIGDVAGHGLDAGLVMLMIQSGLACLTRENPGAEPHRILERLNMMLYDNIRRRLGREEFATLSLLRYHQSGRMIVAGAHEDIIVWRAKERACERIATPGTWLGAVNDVGRYMISHAHQLEKGDLMLLYTDGVTEARRIGGEQFGPNRLCDTMERMQDRPLEEICNAIFSDLHDWSRTQDDDQAVLLVRYLGEPSRTPSIATKS